MIRLSAVWPVFALTLTIGAAEPASAAPRASVRASASDMLALAEEFRKKGDAASAQRILNLLTRDPNVDVRNEARYRLALIREEEGRYRDAAVLLRRILDEKPDASAVRIRLAMLLQKMGEQEASHRELRAVRVTDLPPNVARFVDRLAAAAHAKKPLSLQLELALAPDSNINRATRSDTVGTIFGDFELEEEAKSGVGIAGRGMVQSRLPLTERITLVSRAIGDAKIYRKDEFNDIVAGVSTGPELALSRTVLSLEAAASQQWYGQEEYQRMYRLTGSAVQRVDSASQLRIDASRRWVDDQVNDLRDGGGQTLLGRYERALSPQLSLVANTSIDRFKAEDDAYSTWSWSAGLSAYREIGRMTFNLGAEIGALRSDERLQILLDKRDDRLLRLQLGAVFRQLTVSGFAPVARLVYERNKSTVEFYDYRRLRTEFGISRAF